jgi:sortase A
LCFSLLSFTLRGLPAGKVSRDMGKASKILRGRRRMGLYLLVAVCLALGVLSLGMSVFRTQGEPVKEAVTPVAAPAPEPLVNDALVEAQARAAGQIAREAAAKEAAKRAAREQARKEAAEKKAEQAAAERAAVPPDTTMYLTIPKLGLYDVLVLDGTSEAVLSLGAGHVPGTGYPWISGSNTYIAGHRIGYPGTGSDYVFWNLPSLVAGDQVIVEDSLGQAYTYQVSEVLEVPPTDISVTAPVTGRDMVSLQTCIENYGDYWTPGPNWFVRYVVRADRIN